MHPPPGEVGSPVSLPSSAVAGARGITRVTSDPASTVAIGITANTITAAAGILPTDREGTALGQEGHTAATLLSPPLIAMRCKVGLHSSCTGGEAMLNLGSM